MTQEKKKSKKRQTKAGMMERASDTPVDENNKKKPERDSESKPKINKEKAENRNDNRPLH